jgi:hypothetical protein
MSKLSKGLFALSMVAAIAGATCPAAAVTLGWTGANSHDGDSISFAAVNADKIQFFGINGGPYAHTHEGAGAQTWTIFATVDDVDKTIFSQFLPEGSETSIDDLGVIEFAGGNVTGIGFTCDNCSHSTFHNFRGASFNLTSGAVPEPASWALMIGGFGMIGYAARRERIALDAA